MPKKGSLSLQNIVIGVLYFVDFISNINGLETDDEMKFEVQDILSLKIKRIIAVSWPYYGYLGRAGFSNYNLNALSFFPCLSPNLAATPFMGDKRAVVDSSA